MSPRAAWRLESLGFDYVAGKADWMASGLPVEGKLADCRYRMPTKRPSEVVTRMLPTRASFRRSVIASSGSSVRVVVGPDSMKDSTDHR